MGDVIRGDLVIDATPETPPTATCVRGPCAFSKYMAVGETRGSHVPRSRTDPVYDGLVVPYTRARLGLQKLGYYFPPLAIPELDVLYNRGDKPGYLTANDPGTTTPMKVYYTNVRTIVGEYTVAMSAASTLSLDLPLLDLLQFPLNEYSSDHMFSSGRDTDNADMTDGKRLCLFLFKYSQMRTLAAELGLELPRVDHTLMPEHLRDHTKTYKECVLYVEPTGSAKYLRSKIGYWQGSIELQLMLNPLKLSCTKRKNADEKIDVLIRMLDRLERPVLDRLQDAYAQLAAVAAELQYPLPALPTAAA